MMNVLISLLSVCHKGTCTSIYLTLSAPMVTKINFLLTISIPCQEIRLWELMKWSLKRKCFDLLSNSLNSLCKEIYRDQFGELVCGFWGFKGLIQIGLLWQLVTGNWAFSPCHIKNLVKPQLERSVKQHRYPNVLGPQWTQQITRKTFWTSLQPD